MQVEAIYNKGRIELVHHLRLRHDKVRLLVTVPDEEVEQDGNPYNLSPDVLQKAEEMRQRIDAARRAPLAHDDSLPETTPKQMERIEAFALRSQMRLEQGRPT